MTSSDRPPRGSRRFLWLTVAIVVAILAYTAGWFWVAGEVEARTAAAIDRIKGRGAAAECLNGEARGYPFRIGLFCDAVTFGDSAGQLAFSGEGLRTAAQIYDPFRIVGEMDAARLTGDPARGNLSATARDLRFSARIAQPLPERASLTLQGVSVEGVARAGQPPATVTAAAGEAHMRRNGTAVDVALTASDIEIAPPGMDRRFRLPRASADITLNDGVALAGTPPRSLRGLSGMLRSVAIDTGDEAGITASGPLSVDAQGMLDAELQLTVRNPKRLAAFLAGLFPEQGQQIESGFSGMAMLGDNPTLPLTIRKGRAQIGFIPLGTIPPLE